MTIKKLRELYPNMEFENYKGTLYPMFGVTENFKRQ